VVRVVSSSQQRPLRIVAADVVRRVQSGLSPLLGVAALIDLEGFLASVADLPYVIPKIQAPWTPRSFPRDYPVGKDIDFIVSEDHFGRFCERMDCYRHFESGLLRAHTVTGEAERRLRITLFGALQLQYHAAVTLGGLSSSFIERAIRERVVKDGYYVPTARFEYVFRLAELRDHPYKGHHRAYLSAHKADANENLIRSEKLLRTYEALVGTDGSGR